MSRTLIGRKATLCIRTGGDHDNPEWSDPIPVLSVFPTTTKGTVPMSITSKARAADEARAKAIAANGGRPLPAECRHCGKLVPNRHHRQTCRRMQAKPRFRGRKRWRMKSR